MLGIIPSSWIDDSGDVYLFVAVTTAVLAAAVLVGWSLAIRRRHRNDNRP